jgi:hypothetical protein
MIDLDTLADLLEYRRRFDAYNPRCDRWAEIVTPIHRRPTRQLARL